MKKLLLTALLCFCVNAYAVNWKLVTTVKDGSSFFVDVDNIKKHNGLVYYWELVNYLKPLSGGTNSSINKWKVDCVGEKLTWLNATFYSQSMGKGRILDEGTPNHSFYPKPKSAYYEVMKFSCFRAR